MDVATAHFYFYHPLWSNYQLDLAVSNACQCWSGIQLNGTGLMSQKSANVGCFHCIATRNVYLTYVSMQPNNACSAFLGSKNTQMCTETQFATRLNYAGLPFCVFYCIHEFCTFRSCNLGFICIAGTYLLHRPCNFFCRRLRKFSLTFLGVKNSLPDLLHDIWAGSGPGPAEGLRLLWGEMDVLNCCFREAGLTLW